MEFVIIMAVLAAYLGLSSKLDKLLNIRLKGNKNKFPSLHELVGQNISIEMSDQLDLIFGSKTEGILKEYNDTWIVIETINKKGKKELYYYRINQLVSINIVKKEV